MQIKLVVLSILFVTPALADTFPIAVPSECRRLAIHERVPTIIRNENEARSARDKLLSLDAGEPMVARCRQAAAQYLQFVH